MLRNTTGKVIVRRVPPKPPGEQSSTVWRPACGSQPTPPPTPPPKPPTPPPPKPPGEQSSTVWRPACGSQPTPPPKPPTVKLVEETKAVSESSAIPVQKRRRKKVIYVDESDDDETPTV